ncbi:MAG: multicopper oxidase domain-containing protein [Oligoflexales bacterium]
MVYNRLLLSILASLANALVSMPLLAKTVHYELTATRGQVNLSGKQTVDFALMINGSIPAPTLEFTEGDDAEIVLKNEIPDDELSVHWHGILLPPEMDGVPYVNTPPIKPGESYTFRFKVRQHGTYWYHSHTHTQEQKGVYGGLIIHPKEKTIQYDKDIVVVLSDWSDENPDQIVRNLKKDGDYYTYKKGTMRSYIGAIQAGGLKTHLGNEWIRMGGMDLSDVGYDAFLINGKKDSQLAIPKPGERVRMRIINAAGSSYFYLSLGQNPMKVISADGVDIEPVMAKEILIGMAETYDILFEMPNEAKNFELRATCQDVTGYASGWIGDGEKVPAPDKQFPNMYAGMDHSSMGHGGMDHGSMDHSKMNHSESAPPQAQETTDGAIDHSKMDHSKMDHSKMKTGDTAETSTIETLTVDGIRSPNSTAFEKSKRIHDVKLALGGDMERYTWFINDKTIDQDRNIIINEGDVVRFTFVNETMMHHPFHLHGHFFRVLTEAGDFSPMKHTVDVPPHGSRTIEFFANEPGEWMLHCHNLYHMKTGMARVVKYATFTPGKEIAPYQHHDPHLHDHIYSRGMAEASTNHIQGAFELMRTWDSLGLRFESRKYTDLEESEADLLYKRWYSQFFYLIGGASYFSEFSEDKTRGVLGVGYTLPMLIETQFFVDHKGMVRLDIEKRLQWTKYIFSDIDASFRQGASPEFEASLMYASNWSLAAGLMFTESDAGVGAQYRF